MTEPRLRTFRLCLALPAFCAGAAACAAEAVPADVLDFYVSGGYTHDNNLFRLPGTSARSDNVLGLTAGVKLDKPIGQQRFLLDASFSHNRYASHDQLDHSTFQYDGAWRWHVTPRISGLLSVVRQEALNGFDYYRIDPVTMGQAKNMRVTYVNRFEADYWVGGDWHALAGLNHYRRSNSRVLQEPDASSTGWNAGVRYDTGAGRSLALRYYCRDGDYPRGDPLGPLLLDNAFRQREYELLLDYPISDKTRIEGRFAHVRRSHPHFPVRDYQGWEGDLSLDWALTGKLSFVAEAHRRIETWQDGTSSYALITGFSAGPRWAMSAKQLLDLRLEYDERRHQGPPFPTSPLRDDERTALALSWTWEPNRNFLFGLSLRRERRDSNLPGYDYQDTALGIQARLRF